MESIWHECDRFDAWFSNLHPVKMCLVFSFMVGIPIIGVIMLMFAPDFMGSTLMIVVIAVSLFNCLLFLNEQRKKFQE